jgi:hypothetical protein
MNPHLGQLGADEFAQAAQPFAAQPQIPVPEVVIDVIEAR